MKKKLICGLMAATMVFSGVSVVSAESSSRDIDSERSRQPFQQGSEDYLRPGDLTNLDMLMPRKFVSAPEYPSQGLERASEQTDRVKQLLEDVLNLESLIQMYRQVLYR